MNIRSISKACVAALAAGWISISAWCQSPAPNPAMAGLWAGEVTLNEVTHVAGGTNAPVNDTAQMRILIHVDAAGVPRLLKDVIVARKATGPGPVPETAVVILSDPNLLPGIPGLARPNGKLLAQRLATASYEFAGNEFRMDGGLGEGNRCTGTLRLSESHPVNPFMHRFGRDHATGVAIDRNITLTFGVPPGSANGITRLSGQYEEIITGLHKASIRIAGSVVLNRISPVAVLNQ